MISLFILQVHVICFVESEKYRRFKSTIDSYIEEHFSGALAYKYVVMYITILKFINRQRTKDAKKFSIPTFEGFLSAARKIAWQNS